MNSIKTAISLNGSAYLFMLGVGLITPQLPGKMFTLSQSALHVGGLAAAFALSYVVIQIPMGVFADRFGHKQFIVLGYTACGIAGVLYLLAKTPNVLIFGRIIQGIGEAPLWALPPAILSLTFEKKKARAIGWYNGSIHLGLTSGSTLGLVAAKYLTEESLFQLYILLCFLAVTIILFGVQKDKSHVSTKTESLGNNLNENITLLMKPRVFIVLKSVTFYGIGYGTFMTIIPSYLSEQSSWNTMSSSLCFMAFYLGITIAQFIGGPITDKVGRIFPMITGLLLFSVGIILFTHMPSQIMFWIILIMSFGLGIYLTGSIAYLNDQVGACSKGFASGLFYCFWGIGYFFGPILLGYLSELGLFEYGIRGLGFLGLTITIFILIFLQNREDPRQNINVEKSIGKVR